ncbi:MAG: glycosyltransferase family 4 protein [Fimbriimonadaceae bacterium]|nr:glycosyltransferase family 4 protein [Fimbriimonadaceae bacterium]
MRVAFPAWRLLHPRGGVGNTLWQLLQQYAALAPEDQFRVFHDGAPLQPPPGANLTTSVVRAPLVENNLTWSDSAAPRAIRRWGAELVHNVAYTLPRGLTCPAVVTVHDVSYARHPEWYPRRTARWLTAGTRRALQQATVVTDSEFSRREIAALFDTDPTRLAVVPLAADPIYTPTVDPTPVRQRYQLPERFIFYLGGIHARRRFEHLLTACRGLLPRHGADLVIAGPYDPAALADSGLGERLRPLGYVPDADLPGLFRAATCFAWPSVYEGFGLPPLEALACGCPTVVAEASSLPEVVGDAALRVADDPAALAAALGRLLEDDSLRRELAARGPRQASRFSWTTTAQAMLRIYRETLEQQV